MKTTKTQQALETVRAAITSDLNLDAWRAGAEVALVAFQTGNESAMRRAGHGIGYRLEQGYTWASRKITLGIVEDLGW